VVAEPLQAEKINIGWSGRRRCFDNILFERMWRTAKYAALGFSPQTQVVVYL
jgi:hypothetical protein